MSISRQRCAFHFGLTFVSAASLAAGFEERLPQITGSLLRGWHRDFGERPRRTRVPSPPRPSRRDIGRSRIFEALLRTVKGNPAEQSSHGVPRKVFRSAACLVPTENRFHPYVYGVYLASENFSPGPARDGEKEEDRPRVIFLRFGKSKRDTRSSRIGKSTVVFSPLLAPVMEIESRQGSGESIGAPADGK